MEKTNSAARHAGNSEAPRSLSFVSVGPSSLVGHPVTRSAGDLRLHPAFLKLKLAALLINSECEGKPRGVREPILSTTNGTLIAGIADWHHAVSAGEATKINCVEFALTDDEALQLILSLRRSRGAWSDFTRTELALQQVSYFQANALTNQIAGGKYKGLANLPKAEHIDVREEVANLAGVSARTVGSVKLILKKAHSTLIEALRNGTVTINRGLAICQMEKSQQTEELTCFLAERSNDKTNREYIDKLRAEKISADLNVFLTELQQLEATTPGSVEVRSGKGNKTVIIIGRRHLNDLSGRIGAL